MEKRELVTIYLENNSISIASTMPSDPILISHVLKSLESFQSQLLKKSNELTENTIKQMPIPSEQKEILSAINDAFSVVIMLESIIKKQDSMDRTMFQKIKDMKKILEGC